MGIWGLGVLAGFGGLRGAVWRVWWIEGKGFAGWRVGFTSLKIEDTRTYAVCVFSVQRLGFRFPK